MRLDRALVDRGLAESRTRAARLIADGQVKVDGVTVTKTAHPVGTGSRIELSATDRYVARSAHKLAGALRDMDLFSRIAGRRCLDAGASTGGFTQVLLEHGAARVEAVDVGHGQLHPRIAARPEVSNREGTTVRGLAPEDIGGPVDLTVADLSFISLELVLPSLAACTRPGGWLLLMVKPQFELQRADLDSHGVVTDPGARARALTRVLHAAAGSGLQVSGAAASRLPGPSGNLEYFLFCDRVEEDRDPDPRVRSFIGQIAAGHGAPAVVEPVRPAAAPRSEEGT